ncbi:MAG: oligosaccharide flippase family protein [Pseudomonadota bacterium]
MLARLRQSEFVANVTKVLAGNGLVVAISLFAIPIISRLYTPDDYGVIGLFISVVAVIAVFATLKYEMAMVLPDNESDARQLLRATLWVAVLVALVTLVLVAVVRVCCEQTGLVQGLGHYAWWLPLAVLLSAAFKLLVNGWMIRQKQFGRMAVAEMSNSLVNIGIRIALGFWIGSTVWGLLAGLLIGFAAGLIVAFPVYRHDVRHQSGAALFGMLRKYPEFPTYTMPADFVRTFAQNLPVIFFGFMYSPAVAGLFYMANRLIKAPVELGLHAFRGVFLQKVSAMHNDRLPLRGTYLKTMLVMLVLGIGPAFVLYGWGQELLTFVLGSDWREAGVFAEILAPLLLSFWITSPAAMLLITLRRQNYWLAVQATIAVLQVGVFAYAHATGQSASWTLQVFVLVQIVVNVLLKVLVYGLLDTDTGREELA